MIIVWCKKTDGYLFVAITYNNRFCNPNLQGQERKESEYIRRTEKCKSIHTYMYWFAHS
jgi:hypothetical protein